MVSVPTPQGRAALRSLRDVSFSVRVECLFDSCLLTVRNHGGPYSSLEGYKHVLNKYLDIGPDRPRDMASGWWLAPTNQRIGTNSNSVTHCRSYLQKIISEYEWLQHHYIEKG